MPFQILLQSFMGKEFRLVRHPLGGRKPGSSVPVNPPSPGPASGDRLDDTFEFAHQVKVPTAFHRKARESLRRCGEVLDALVGSPHEVLFLTGTFPFFHARHNAAIAPHSGWIVKRLKNWLRQYTRTNYDFYCWERQKNGGLHLHMAVWIPERASNESVQSRFHRFWVDTISALSERSGVNFFLGRGGRDWSSTPEVVQAYSQPVRKSVGRYLAKYCSKSHGKATLDVAGRGWGSPQRWWGSSSVLKEKVREFTTEERHCFATWLQSRNEFQRITEKLIALQLPAKMYIQSSQSHDGESLTIYIEDNQASWKEIIWKTFKQSRKHIRMQSPADDVWTSFRVEASKRLSQAGMEMRDLKPSCVVSQRCYAIVDGLHGVILSPNFDSESVRVALNDSLKESSGRLSSLQYRVSFHYYLEARISLSMLSQCLEDVSRLFSRTKKAEIEANVTGM